MNEHGPECECSLCALRKLDEATSWEPTGEVRADGDDDDGMAGGLASLHLLPKKDDRGEGLDSPETVENICNTVNDMGKNGVLDDIITIVNTKDGDQFLFTTLNRNDHIIGMLSVATMNWHSSQIAAQNLLEEE